MPRSPVTNLPPAMFVRLRAIVAGGERGSGVGLATSGTIEALVRRGLIRPVGTGRYVATIAGVATAREGH